MQKLESHNSCQYAKYVKLHSDLLQDQKEQIFDSFGLTAEGASLSESWVVAFPSFGRIRGECSTIHSPPALFFFFFEVEISSRTHISLHTPKSVHSG